MSHSRTVGRKQRGLEEPVLGGEANGVAFPQLESGDFCGCLDNSNSDHSGTGTIL
ncbi:hypothetical protein DPMN_077832 [Dreissena polymorpha]|uniref:Uncharacterized protein n=1 Tax=Dreissena polymorpha TaxID=45954 RepID=A0A9D3YQQ5_DREPO|nr:hypothetical protein DPMN_077832 [Dreissena polymorpha]